MHPSSDTPPAAYSTPYDGSQKPHQPPMSQIHHQRTYSSSQPSSARSSYYHQYIPSPQVTPGLASNPSPHDSVISYPKSPMDSYAPSTHSAASYSLKYAIRKESMAVSDLEKLDNLSSHDEPTYPPSALSRDPEKRVLSSASPRRSDARSSQPDVERGLYGVYDDREEPMDLQSKAFSILLYLSLLNPLVSFAILFWTIMALFITAFLLPLRALGSSTLSLTDLVLPSLRLQLRLIYSPHVHPDTPASPGTVAIIHLLSPFLSFIFAVGSWVVALFWFFSAVLGDPAGKDGHNDGKAAVIWIRNNWERWLLKGYTNYRP